MSEYERIKRACLKSGELWEDPEFPATQASVFYHQTPPFQFQWKRPKVSSQIQSQSAKEKKKSFSRNTERGRRIKSFFPRIRDLRKHFPFP